MGRTEEALKKKILKRVELIRTVLIYEDYPIIEDLNISRDEFLDNQFDLLKQEAKDINFNDNMDIYSSKVEWLDRLEEVYNKDCIQSDIREYAYSSYKQFN